MTVTGNSNLQGDLTVTGDSKLNGKLEITDKATLKGGLNVAGGTTTDTLTVTGDSKLNGKLEVDGTFSAAEGNFFVAADGATDIAANLNVKDDIVSEGGKETKFFSFERYDQADKVTYIAGFSKEKIVVMSFVFGKDAKLQNFSFSPYKAPEQAPAEKK